MPTSSVVEIFNASPEPVFLRIVSSERTTEYLVAAAGGRLELERRPSLPAAGDAAASAAERFEIEVGGRIFALWQDAGSSSIRFAAEGSPAGQGSTLGGGDFLRLIVGEDGGLAAEEVSAAALLPAPPEILDPNEQVAPEAVPEGQYLGPIYGELRRQSRDFDGVTYGMTADNSVDGEWLLQTPNYFGKPARDLPNSHSQSFVDRIGALIASAEHTVDITLLYPEPTGGAFLDAICRGIAALAEKNREAVVRILIGNYPTKLADTEGLLKRIAIQAPRVRGSKLRIYAAGMMVTVGSWNHAKIVAADSRRVIVGGHNLWNGDYLCAAPVNDVSMQIEGPAARFAHGFSNRLWAHVAYWNRWAVGIYSNDYHGPSGNIGRSALAHVPLGHYSGSGRVPMLALGRTGIMDWGKGNQSDVAFRLALALAKSSVKVSQQDLLLVVAGDPLLLRELAHVVLRDLPLAIVLTNPGATSGAGGTYSTLAPLDLTIKTVVAAIVTLGTALRIEPRRIAELVQKNLRIAPIRFSADPEWPADRAHSLCGQERVARKIANHAKVWIVDDQLFYVGSQNFYPSDNQEFGYAVHDATAAATLLRDYWNPLWQHSSRVAQPPSLGEDLTISFAAAPGQEP